MSAVGWASRPRGLAATVRPYDFDRGIRLRKSAGAAPHLGHGLGSPRRSDEVRTAESALAFHIGEPHAWVTPTATTDRLDAEESTDQSGVASLETVPSFLELAKRRLGECAFFGLMERYADSMLLLKHTFPVALTQFESYGGCARSPSPPPDLRWTTTAWDYARVAQAPTVAAFGPGTPTSLQPPSSRVGIGAACENPKRKGACRPREEPM